MGVREATFGVVQLRGRHPEVEEDALHAVEARGGDNGRDLVVEGVHERHPALVGGQHGTGPLDRGHVGVDADQDEAGVGGEQRPGVAGPAERRVEQDGAVRRQGGREQGGDGVGHDRHVAGG